MLNVGRATKQFSRRVMNGLLGSVGAAIGLNFASKNQSSSKPMKNPFYQWSDKRGGYHTGVILATRATFMNAVVAGFTKPFFGDGFIFGNPITFAIHDC